MKKEYIRPEAELTKFVETEEIMDNTFGIDGVFDEGSTMPTGWVGQILSCNCEALSAL